ncbi:nucleotidyltransferase domain-containing protein [bacterium]|nr:nucleotidyltransferase domain-containing protein [bacterium]
MIDLTPAEMKIVIAILERYLPDLQIRVYGPRATGKAKEQADLDLCLMNKEQLPFETMGTLLDAFSQSELPFNVDITEWAVATGEMRKRIERDGKVLL